MEKRRKHVPLRSCIACQRKRPKRELIRVVRTPEGTIEVDPKGKRAGRGAYLCSDRRCWNEALQTRKLGHALKCQVSEEDLAEVRSWLSLLTAEAQDELPTSEQKGSQADSLDGDNGIEMDS
ncbi:MAG: RNase P modulator RnpM [Anaerolineae bacterium]